MPTPARAESLEVEGRTLKLTNLDKVLYPACGFTKAMLVDYYVRISHVMLPHLRGRPLTLKRYPDGVDAGHFYEKNCPSHRPRWVRTVHVVGRRGDSSVDYCSADDLPTLVWLANLATIEMHPLLCVGTDLDRPTSAVFDLDPGDGRGVLDCAEVARWIRCLLSDLGLECRVKSSGSKGLQVYLPLNSPHTFAETRAFARAVAELLVKRHPGTVVSNMRKSLRKGRVLVDWSQNASSKTTVCVYSLRAGADPTVSTPLMWDEVESALSRQSPDDIRFSAGEVLERVQRDGDLFDPVVTLRQRLPKAGDLREGG